MPATAMAEQRLTVRNVTSTSIELKLHERFEAFATPEPNSALASIARNLTSLVRSPPGPRTRSAPSADQLTANTLSFSSKELSVPMAAFSSCRTEIRPPNSATNEILRLTFENNGERYRVDVPCPASRSTTLIPLAPNPRFLYTAVYLPLLSFLTLYSSANLQCWMRELSDDTPLSALSIPGTHNSPAYYRALPSVRCQAVSPRAQLENGVRFFDIRVQPESPHDPAQDGLILVHGAFPISLTGPKYFRDLVDDITAFLVDNPTETLIMSLKREGTGDATDAQLGRLLREHYATDVDRWFTQPHIPKLGEARGKIVLVRRFGVDRSLKSEWNGAGWAIDAETWADNTPNATCPSGDICVQDFYEVMDTESIDKKITYCEAHLDRAGACVCPLPGASAVSAGPGLSKQPLYINFLSASNFWNVGCWPERIAARLNPAIVAYLCTKHGEPAPGKQLGDGTTGIVVCDWAGNNGNWDLVRCIVGMNAKLELRGKRLCEAVVPEARLFPSLPQS